MRLKNIKGATDYVNNSVYIIIEPEKIKGKCIYYKTCYGIHNYSSDDESYLLL